MSEFNRNINERLLQDHVKKTDMLEKAATAHGGINLDTFRNQENSRDVDRDKNYVRKQQERFGEREKNNYGPRALELLMALSISQGNLLPRPNEKCKPSEAVATSKYDDYRNRMDIAVSYYAREGEEPIVFGVDATTSSNPDVIREKILISSNDRTYDGPIGSSQIRYFKNREGQKYNLRPVLRYCIGISKECVDGHLEFGVKEIGGVLKTEPDRGSRNRNLTTQFKVIKEMLDQNKLFMAQFDKRYDNDEELDPEEATLYDEMYELNKILEAELERIAQTMPDEILRVGTERKVDHSVDAVVQKLKKDDKSFACILDTTDKLYQECRKVEEEGGDAAEALRTAKTNVEVSRRERNDERSSSVARQASRVIEQFRRAASQPAGTTTPPRPMTPPNPTAPLAPTRPNGQ